jgi:hypothetical protein
VIGTDGSLGRDVAFLGPFGLLGGEDLEALERELELDDECLRLDLGRTQPSGVARPRGVIDSSGELLDRPCFKRGADAVCLVLFLCPECDSLVGDEARTSEVRDIRLASASKVLIASIREALERFKRAW